MASKVASALDYAHRRRDAEGHELNIVHRDVSPQNILISYEGDIKLCDFGIAKAASKASQTQSGALKGKMQYMSPEQAWGRAIDRRSDLFSLGVVLHELLTGDRLFRGDTDINILEKVRNADVAPPSRSNPEVPKNLDAVVLKALAKDPDDRYTNASDLLRDLDSVLYSYAPAPGSADVAIYLHRLQAEESAMAEAKAREAAQVAHDVEPAAARKRKSKGVPVSRKIGVTPKAVAPVPAPESPPPPKELSPPPVKPAPPLPEVFGSLEARVADAEKRSRMPLYIAIAAAALVLAGFLAWRSLKSAPPAAVVVKNPTAVAAIPTIAVSAPVPTAAAPMDPKAVEAEVQRQLAARRKELEKTAAAAKKAPGSTPEIPAPAVAAPAAVEPTLVAPTEVPTAPPTARPEPTAAPTEPPPVEAPRPAAVPVRETEVQRGDLVGPGAGVVEPQLLSSPRVVYPPMARQQRVGGRVVVLVLVDETGRVIESRLQQGVEGQAAVNEAVLSAIKTARFRAASKNGIPVKMWRPVIVEVKP
jgi:TonB family protein